MLLDIPSIVKSDLARSDTSSREFHVTSMSADLANAIARHVSSCKRPVPSAFDVGTGSGLHAVTCAACGIDRILAIDISGEAVELAKQRFERIGSELRRLEQPVAIPEFVCADFASMPSQTGQFSLVMSNPPSFFFCDLEDEDKSPLWYALFDGPKGDASNPRSSFIYRFFDTAVRKFLEPGGTVFCMWPAIERRLTSSEFGPLVHPAELLQQWFGWRIDGNNLEPESFYLRKASVEGYGAGRNFVQNVLRDMATGTCYSETMQTLAGPGFSFRYGIFCMERLAADHFRFVSVPLG